MSDKRNKMISKCRIYTNHAVLKSKCRTPDKLGCHNANFLKIILGGFKEISPVLIYLNIFNFKTDLQTLEYDDKFACNKLKKLYTSDFQ